MSYHCNTPILRWSRVLLILLAAAAGHSCAVPVFAYAMRHWEPQPHALRTARDAAGISATNRTLTGWQACAQAESAGTAAAGVFWPGVETPWHQGELHAGQLDSLATSPVRRELVRRLVAGDAAVWLFVGGRDSAADAAALDRLRKRLHFLEGTIELPTPAETDQAADATGAPLLPLHFSILECAPSDPAEWATIAQLRALAQQADGALIAPVFARARVLTSQPASEWTNEFIDSVAFFLTGSCSCQVKEMNPGSDLLVCADWKALLAAAPAGSVPAPTPTVAPAGTLPARIMPPAVLTPPVEQVVIGFTPQLTTEPTTSRLGRGGWILTCLGLLLAGALVLVKTKRDTRP